MIRVSDVRVYAQADGVLGVGLVVVRLCAELHASVLVLGCFRV